MKYSSFIITPLVGVRKPNPRFLLDIFTQCFSHLSSRQKVLYRRVCAFRTHAIFVTKLCP